MARRRKRYEVSQRRLAKANEGDERAAQLPPFGRGMRFGGLGAFGEDGDVCLDFGVAGPRRLG